MSASDRHFLLTAFGPFPGLDVNPVTEIMARLADQWRNGAPSGLMLETHVLPTEYGAVDEWVASRLNRNAPALLIMLGYSSLADRLKIEARASNQCAPNLADASGFRPVEQAIAHHLPSTLPLDAIADVLSAAGIDHVRSDDCGEYVCNYIFYRVQAQLAERSAATLSGFIHVPPVDFGQGRIVPDEPARSRPIDELLRGIELIVQVAARTA